MAAFDVDNDARTMMRALLRMAGADMRASVSVEDIAADAFRKPRPARHVRRVWKYMQDQGWAGTSGTKVKTVLNPPADLAETPADTTPAVPQKAAGRKRRAGAAPKTPPAGTGAPRAVAPLDFPGVVDAARDGLRTTRDQLRDLATEVSALEAELLERDAHLGRLRQERDALVAGLGGFRSGLTGGLAEWFDTELGDDLWTYGDAEAPAPNG